MLVMLSHPKLNRLHPDSCLNLLLYLGSSLHEKLPTTFKDEIPILQTFLNGAYYYLESNLVVYSIESNT